MKVLRNTQVNSWEKHQTELLLNLYKIHSRQNFLQYDIIVEEKKRNTR
jgi:hypothetical protein